MTEPARYLVTAALPYANGPLHIGQIAGAYLPPDIYVRYLRSLGRDVVFVCGSDEHGAAITLRAKKDGLSPSEIIDRFHNINKDAFAGLGIDFDIYHRTSAQLHHETSQEIFRVLLKNDAFEIKETEQYYDKEYNQFLADRYIIGTCPKCGNDRAYGDQCEKCGSSLSPTELIDPHSTLSGNKPVLRKTSHWYFPLNKYEDWLRRWIVNGEGQTESWKKNVLGQVKSWLDDGLLPRAMTRDLDWGVKVPVVDGYVTEEQAEGKVMYVWLDAPVGYISATRQWAADNGKDWEPYWKSTDTKLLHFIGKDNIVFHCVIFPSILKAHGDFIMPSNVPANEFMNMEGDKISTSRNWAVWIPEYIKDFPDQVDVLRYALCANSPETKDSEFTWKDWQTRNNSELVATFGNFVNRVVVLVGKYFDGVVPAADLSRKMKSGLSVDSSVSYAEVISELKNRVGKIAEEIEVYRFRDAQRSMMSVAEYGNGFLQFNEPWKKIKEDPDQVASVLFTALQIVSILAVVCEPFLPFTAKKIALLLNQNETDRGSWSRLKEQLSEQQPSLINEGHKLGNPGLLFEKIPDEIVEEQLEKLNAMKQSNVVPAEAPELKDTIQFEDFSKMDLRTATVIEAVPVPKADKLLRLEVDMGFEKRTIVSGIAAHFKPENLIGKKVVVLANLAPRKLRGVESQGMILLAEDKEGKLIFIGADDEVPNGSSIS